MTRLGHTMVFVADVLASVEFYERAFGLERDHVDDDGSYGEVKVADRRIGFVSEAHAARHLASPFRPNRPSEPPAGFEIYLEVDDVDRAFERAVGVGAIALSEPTIRPWGTRSAYLRDLDGILVELAGRPH